MPELPDVEGYRRGLARRLPGERVRRVHIRDEGVLRNASPRAFRQKLTGHRFGRPDRHGKWLILPTDGPTIYLHSGMTGRPYFTADGAEPEKLDRLLIDTDSGVLHYTDLRKLRGVWISDRPLDDIAGRQGPDALQISADEFVSTLHGRGGRLKSALTNQAVIAGLGNLLADEICWRAKENPARPVSSMSEAELRKLHRGMRSVLRTSVRHGRVPALPRWLTGARDKSPACCPRCRSRLRHERQGGRTTYWCPACQPE